MLMLVVAHPRSMKQTGPVVMGCPDSSGKKSISRAKGGGVAGGGRCLEPVRGCKLWRRGPGKGINIGVDAMWM